MTVLVDTLDLKGLRRDLHRKHYQQQAQKLQVFHDTASDYTSLTAKHMSLALHSMSRQAKDHRLSNRDCRFALNRKLCLDCIPHEFVGTKCTCGIEYENKGDHAFGCPDQSVSHKSKLSNGERDTIAHVSQQIAPTAGYVDDANSVTTETPQLLPRDLRKRPTDIGLPLNPSCLQRQSPHAANFLAIDATVPSPPSQSRGATHTAVSATYKHHKAEKKKFDGRDTGSRTAIEDLVTQNMLLLPMSIDHLGGFGTLGHRFLFGQDKQKAPDWSISPPSHPMSKRLCDRAFGPAAAVDMLHAADSNWQQLCPNVRYGPSHHTSLPSQWATQFIGLNLLHGAALEPLSPSH